MNKKDYITPSAQQVFFSCRRCLSASFGTESLGGETDISDGFFGDEE